MSVSQAFTVTFIGIVRASEAEASKGLIGWLTVAINNALLIDGITLRRTKRGALTLSYPERRDRLGERHSVVRPLNDEARRSIETQVFKQLGLSKEAVH